MSDSKATKQAAATEAAVKVKPKYICQHCTKSFKKPSALRSHVYTHTGEKPFACHLYDGCNRRFSVVGNLRRHLKVHQPKHPATMGRRYHPLTAALSSSTMVAERRVLDETPSTIKLDNNHNASIVDAATMTISPASALNLIPSYYYSYNGYPVTDPFIIHEPEFLGLDSNPYPPSVFDFSPYPFGHTSGFETY